MKKIRLVLSHMSRAMIAGGFSQPGLPAGAAYLYMVRA